MILSILANSYPYSSQEAFLEPEIKTCEPFFEEIHIYTLAQNTSTVTRYVPANAKVIQIEHSHQNRFLSFLFFLFSVKTFLEIVFVTFHFKYSLKRSCSMIFYNYHSLSPLFLKELEKEDISKTIFYSYWLSHLAYALVLFKKKHKKAFCVSRCHRFDNFISCDSLFFRREIFQYIDFVFPISQKGYDEIQYNILPLCKKPKSHIKVFHLGVSIPNQINPPKSSNVFRIASCSFVWRIKRLDIIINALSQINDKEIEWIHFGSGKDFAEITSLAHIKLGNKSNIRYTLMGDTSHSRIMDYYKNNHVDLFINSSDHEGIPVSIMEANSFGIPCIARDVGGNSELVSNDYNGYLLPSDSDYMVFYTHIKRFTELSDKEVNDFRSNSKAKILEQYNSPNVFVLFYKFLINEFLKS